MANDLPDDWLPSTIHRSSEIAAVRHDRCARFLRHAFAESTFHPKEIIYRAGKDSGLGKRTVFKVKASFKVEDHRPDFRRKAKSLLDPST
jgi:hypothetical protein